MGCKAADVKIVVGHGAPREKVLAVSSCLIVARVLGVVQYKKRAAFASTKTRLDAVCGKQHNSQRLAGTTQKCLLSKLARDGFLAAKRINGWRLDSPQLKSLVGRGRHPGKEAWHVARTFF